MEGTYGHFFDLSTPHGALGTELPIRPKREENNFQLHTVHQEHKLQLIKIVDELLFQLHTVHQEQRRVDYGGDVGCVFQLHTVHQEQTLTSYCLRWTWHFQLHTVHQERLPSACLISNSNLSTPHGALGTPKVGKDDYAKETFNSTRCIRNWQQLTPCRNGLRSFNSTRCIRNKPLMIALFSKTIFQLHTVHQEPGYGLAYRVPASIYAFNSTRCIRNLYRLDNYRLIAYPAFNSTRCIRNQLYPRNVYHVYYAFNSTRCIRNSLRRIGDGQIRRLSTPHGALGTPNDYIN